VTVAIEATKGATKVNFVLPTDAESQTALEQKVLLYAKDWSVGELLAAVLPTEFGYTVEADGRVGILPRAKAAETLSPAAKETVLRLRRKGEINGTKWAIWINLTATAQGSVLDAITEEAARKPHEIKITLDREGLAAGGQKLDDPMDIQVKDVSVHDMLQMVLVPGCGYAVRRDGSVVLTSLDRVADMVRRGEAVCPAPADNAWTVPEEMKPAKKATIRFDRY
jgi:hypothetical protein